MVFESKKGSLLTQQHFSHLVFATQNEKQLTEEALAACSLVGIEPRDLCVKAKSGDASRDALEEKKRMQMVAIVGNQVLELR